jgi:ribosomal protein S18 acetylase RimI-like enzyme
LRPVEWIEELQIRTAGEKDLPELEWDGEYIHFRRLYRQIYQNACEGKAVIWVAEWGESRVIGQLFCQLSSGRSELADGKERAYLYGFRIKPDFRSKGIGSRMLDAVEQDLVCRQFEKVTLNVGKDNPLALNFYQKHGYQITGTEAGRWSFIDHLGLQREVNEPAWRMEKRLGLDVRDLLDCPKVV